MASRTSEAGLVRSRVVGKHCESGDILIKHAVIAAPEAGDILVMPGTGAYCYAMASNYNGTPRPAVVMINDGRARVIIARETYDDLVAKHRSIRD